MSGLESVSRNSVLEERAHKIFGEWALAHAGSEMVVRAYDPHDPYQNIENTYLEPSPNLQVAEQLGRHRMGDAAYDKLMSGFREFGVVKRCFKNHRGGKSTLIATLHLRNVFDTTMTHNNLFVTSGDTEFAQINDIVVNPIMSRMELAEPPGIAAYDVLLLSGGIDSALPSESAANRKMPPADIARLEHIYARGLISRLRKGVAIHWSLPGTRGKQIENKFYIGKVSDTVANFAKKKFVEAIPVPMDVQNDKIDLTVLPPRPLDTVEDVHQMMDDMAQAASAVTGLSISYGLPEEE